MAFSTDCPRTLSPTPCHLAPPSAPNASSAAAAHHASSPRRPQPQRAAAKTGANGWDWRRRHGGEQVASVHQQNDDVLLASDDTPLCKMRDASPDTRINHPPWTLEAKHTADLTEQRRFGNADVLA